MDRSPGIRATLRESEHTLMISAGLVMLVVFLFLGSARAALIPSLAIPVSLIGTFAIMYLYGFSLNNLSLMALIVAAGLVVDDAIVVLENISRHIERGLSPFRAAMRGSAEVGFTLLAMNLSDASPCRQRHAPQRGDASDSFPAWFALAINSLNR
jgi:multidrug efflux pump